MNKLVLIDGNSIANRAFYALPLLNNDKGVYTNAVYGFAMMLMNVLEKEKPSHVLVAFDAGKTTFRHTTFKGYKGGRQKTPSELSEQFPFIRELLTAYDIPQYELANYEADDIIGTLTKKAEADGMEVAIITGDRDLTQLASEKTTVYITKKGIADMETNTPETLKEKYNLTPEQIIDMKGLMGDSSDNIPGIPGVGEKTALKLLHEFGGTVESVLEHAEEISGKKLKEKVLENKELAILSKELATINVDSPIEYTVESTKYDGYQTEKVIPLLKEMNFTTLLKNIEGDTPEESKELKELSFEIVTELKEQHFGGKTALYVELENDNYHTANFIGLTVHSSQGTYFFTKETAESSEAFRKWVESDQTKVVYDAKKTIVAMNRIGLAISGITFDIMLASYLLNPSDSIDDFTSVAVRHDYTEVETDEAVYGKGAKRSTPEESIVAAHLARKAVAIADLEKRLVDDLEKNEQLALMEDLELPLTFVLAEMEMQGVSVDTDRLEDMKVELGGRLKTLEASIHSLAGEEFNINSPKQLGVILFEKLELPPVKKTKTGYSTAADVLESLSGKHAIIDEILLYRQLGKIQSTYIEGLLKVTDKETHKVHTRFNQTLTQTGRLSSVDPNLQNIPIRLEEGRKIRQVFVPSKPGWKMFSADYSQVELRVLAHISEDENLIYAFKHDYDIHTKTAMDVFHVEKEEVDSLMRRQAKAVNFGIVYGISDYGLSQNLGITRKEAKDFIDRYFVSYPAVKEYMQDIVRFAKEKGYVETILHRRRYIPEIVSRNFNVRGFAERTAMNTPIQGSAADIIKKAMILMSERLVSEKLEAKLLLQVHDELIFEAPEAEIAKLEEIVPDVMENAVELSVPLKVDSAFGDTWYDAK
ncbi:DNA polymerase I [Listeria monocytogenes]|uniref:DNA polymerase I n=1 Tax=Listeria monocytogenes TaxID=1639 RepID=UPI0011EB279C|nr:DNA polymerase I [Listeria monocytogenes]EHC5287203.1 DNA polymerase I [Listeria monocytogenes serotype 1/2a]EAF4815820.1 DNA polymerase I [Listeria monocytogenes]EHC6207352.1 DNA polymerase I [Listeria monocytogenes serotype 1/2a]EHC6344476.1 DNA polymerase I [Listeria monocytogenes serotype 1/2a]EID2622172.1 DNA polymerase I [Listeria monocytogenes]